MGLDLVRRKEGGSEMRKDGWRVGTLGDRSKEWVGCEERSCGRKFTVSVALYVVAWWQQAL